MQKSWELIDDQTGAIAISLLADTSVGGVTISNTQNWHSQEGINKVISMLGVASQWLIDNQGAA
jgi:hypothetical protein